MKVERTSKTSNHDKKLWCFYLGSFYFDCFRALDIVPTKTTLFQKKEGAIAIAALWRFPFCPKRLKDETAQALHENVGVLGCEEARSLLNKFIFKKLLVGGTFWEIFTEKSEKFEFYLFRIKIAAVCSFSKMFSTSSNGQFFSFSKRFLDF